MGGNLLLFVVIIAAATINGQRQPGAKWMPSRNFYENRLGQPIKWIIIHGTAGGVSAEGIGRWFQRSTNAATHYTIGKDGTIVQSVDEKDGAWGNGQPERNSDPWWPTAAPNLQSISIEHVKDQYNKDELTPAQKEASFRLIRDITRRHPQIKKDWADSTGGITGHFSIQPQRKKLCPGPYPWEELLDHLNSVGSSGTCKGTTTSDQNVRSAPTTTGSVVETLRRGMTVTLSRRALLKPTAGTTSTWFRAPNGYVSGAYLRLQGAPGVPRESHIGEFETATSAPCYV